MCIYHNCVWQAVVGVRHAVDQVKVLQYTASVGKWSCDAVIFWHLLLDRQGWTELIGLSLRGERCWWWETETKLCIRNVTFRLMSWGRRIFRRYSLQGVLLDLRLITLLPVSHISPDTEISENFPDVTTSLERPPHHSQGGHINNTPVPLQLSECLKCKFWR